MENSMILEISALLAVIAFVVLVIFVIMTLSRILQSLKQSNEILKKLEVKIDPISSEALRLLQNSADLTESLHEKIDDISPLTYRLLHNMTELTESLNEKVETFSPHALRLLENTTELTESLHEELEAIYPLIDSFTPLSSSLSNIGYALEDWTSSWVSQSGYKSEKNGHGPHKFWSTSTTKNGAHAAHKEEAGQPMSEKIMSIIEMIAAGIMAWQESKKRR